MADNGQSKSNSILDADGKLSAASAATSLKYAKARDLPSYPSTGGVKLSSAGAAASLAASSQKSFEHWKPSPIPAANRAAMLAKDHKMDPLWQPEASAAGSKAAMAALANPIEVEPLQPKRPANIKPNVPSAAYDNPENGHRKALMAATASHNRRRSGSMPTQQATAASDSAAAWALKAATKSHKDGASPAPVGGAFTTGDPGFEAARIQNVAKSNVNRQLYTSAPPVAIEVQEKNRQDTLRASAVAMAQKMYAIQQKQIDEAAAIAKSDGHGQALAASRARSSTLTGTPDTVSTGRTMTGLGYENLEEAARKLAQERLAKIHDEHAEYRDYYGQTSPNRSRMSMRRKPRRESSAATDDSDEEQSRKIRSQMSIFKSSLAEVDGKKRQQDRDALIQIAHRNVDAQIRKMDEKVFNDTGKASPAQMEKWEKSAREKAQQDSDDRMQHMGKIHIGGGKYLEQSELDAIARARLQPTLDDISLKAEQRRAKDEEERLDRERKLEQERTEKARAAETSAAIKAAAEKQKQEDKARREEEKRIQREEEAVIKARRDEEKRIQREEEAVIKARRDEEKRILKEGQSAEKDRIRQEKEEKRKSSQNKPGLLSGFLGRRGGAATTTTSDTAVASTAEEQSGETKSVAVTDGLTVHDQVTVAKDGVPTPVLLTTDLDANEKTGTASEALGDPPSPNRSVDESKVLDKKGLTDDEDEAKSPTQSRVKSWMKNKFSGRSDKQKATDTAPSLTQTKSAEVDSKAVEDGTSAPRTGSMRDVAMAGKVSTNETDDMYGSNREVSPIRESGIATTKLDKERRRSSSVSSLSSVYSTKDVEIPTNFTLGTIEPAESDGEQRGRSGLKERLLKKITPGNEQAKDEKSLAPVATNTTDDEFQEARDQFDDDTLAPPPALLSGMKTMSPKGSRDRSRFTEEL